MQWRLEFRHVASPVARLLLSQAGTGNPPFALFGKVGSSPRLYATQNREALLKSLQSAAYRKMGLTVAGLTAVLVGSGPLLLNVLKTPHSSTFAYWGWQPHHAEIVKTVQSD